MRSFVFALFVSFARSDYISSVFQPSCDPDAESLFILNSGCVVPFCRFPPVPRPLAPRLTFNPNRVARCYAMDNISWHFQCEKDGNASRTFYDNIDCSGKPSSHGPGIDAKGCHPNGGPPTRNFINMTCRTGHYNFADDAISIQGYLGMGAVNFSCPVYGPPSFIQTMALNTCISPDNDGTCKCPCSRLNAPEKRATNNTLISNPNQTDLTYSCTDVR